VPEITIIDVRDAEGFARIPLCADPGFDHRSCDYWEDADRGSRAARLSWWDRSAAPAPAPRLPAANPFAPTSSGPAFNPFAGTGGPSIRNPFGDDDDEASVDNPFAPRRDRGPAIGADQPRKLQLLGRGLAIFGTYAKVLEVDGRPAVYAQFGPLSAYPRAQRVRELYSRLPSAPLPAVITCIAATPAARGAGLARRLVAAICEDLTARGFAAVEAYPDPGAHEDATSAATAAFWLGCGFATAIDDDRYPVMRREL
jgi:GNAT superfamily N-acetyltransferase